MGEEYYVVLIETASNQRTIFQTNRLRENIGASDQIYNVGTRLVLEGVGIENAATIAANPNELEKLLLAERRIAEIDKSEKTDTAEVLIATSGKAIVLTLTRRRAEEIISSVTWNTLSDASGVVVRGAIQPVRWGEDEEAASRLNTAIKMVHQELEALRSRLPSPDLRLARLPFVAECRSSGLPAMRVFDEDPNLDDEVSRTIVGKRLTGWTGKKRDDRARGVWPRMENSLPGIRFERNIDKFDGWMAIVHADGNGLGQVFLDFHGYARAKSPRDYIDKLRKFSLAIDRCSRTAVKAAIMQTWPNEEMKPIVPVVLGGDDLTVICDGTRAVKFAAAYLRKFEAESQRDLGQPLGDIVPMIMSGEGARFGRLSGAAGVAIVKPHFPFHRAYEIAEELTKSAKKVKKQVQVEFKDENGEDENRPYPCSALDFQVVLDSSGSDLDLMRERMTVEEKTALFARPYIVTPPEMLQDATSGHEWAKHRYYGLAPEREKGAEAEQEAFRDLPTLRRAVCALHRPPNEPGVQAKAGEGHLPRSQAHVLRAGLDRGKDAANGALKLIKGRYADFDWGAFLSKNEGDKDSLFFTDLGGACQCTRLLDAIEIADLEVVSPARIVTEGEGP